ncbi:malate dehydrogenase [Psychrobacillus soli]|uniref:Malate dehydrogenase n=1 Tax=Psychrobacillus soli TaxID=1543965 RepID=A0A544SU41_9BACI|nr:malate dehydrogenase [Psychrobacillus soli]TQR08742.1 malate dehydrogenase [Psychrobacillus soli]
MIFKRNKIGIVGAGNTGTMIALMLAQKELGDIVLIDRPELEQPVKGKALDLLESMPIQKKDVRILGTSDYQELTDASIIIITAGMPRKPGMSRDDLINTNSEIMQKVSKEIKRYAPNCYVIVLSNPVDVMTYTCLKTTGFPKKRVIGQSGVLDTARFNTFIAEALNISVEDLTSFVLGGHGDTMVPMLRFSFVGGIPLERIMPIEQIEEIVERTRNGGAEIVHLLGNGSAYIAPAAAVVQMTETILKDKRKIIPVVAYLEGEYGYNDICLGIPCVLGGSGVEAIIEIKLTDSEKKMLDRSAQSVQETMNLL